jgi:dipeptidyl aminopeptidase/acylaminoacyl peptidase
MQITPEMVARCHTIAEPRWSPDGDYIAYVDSFDGRADLYVVPAAGGVPVLLTAEPGVMPAQSYGGGAYAWSPDGEALIYVSKDGQLHDLPRAGGPTKALTRGPGRFSAPVVSPDGRYVACMATTERTQDIVVVDRRGEEWPRRVSRGADFTFDPAWSASGALAWHEWDLPDMPWDAGRIHVAAPDGDLLLVEAEAGISTGQPRFSPDGRTLAYLCDRGGWLNLWLYDVEHSSKRPLREEEAEHGRPAWGPGQMAFAWSPDGREIACVRSEAGFFRLQVIDVASGEARLVGPEAGAVGTVSWSPRGRRLALLYGRGGLPTRLATLDLDTGILTDLLSCAPAGFEAAALPAAEAVSWETPDGATAHGLLYRPPAADDGAASAPPPLLVQVHGGPTSQADAGFNPRTAYWLDRGWAVLLVNYRGSTGYGRAYAQALREQWGLHDVTDTVAGAQAMAERGWVDGRRMAVQGGSAGGYTVLLCLARHADVFAAGVDLFGVADLFLLAEETHRFESRYLDTLIGPLPATYTRYVERSPVTVADQIRAPLLVLQGDADEVVPPNQSQAIVDAVRAKGCTAELHLYPGEGHGWKKVAHIADELTRVEKFLRRHVLRLAGD